jgi:hypothetical protein
LVTKRTLEGAEGGLARFFRDVERVCEHGRSAVGVVDGREWHEERAVRERPGARTSDSARETRLAHAAGAGQRHEGVAFEHPAAA